MKVFYYQRQSDRPSQEHLDLMLNADFKTIRSLFQIAGEPFGELEELFEEFLTHHKEQNLDEKLSVIFSPKDLEFFACFIGNYPKGNK